MLKIDGYIIHHGAGILKSQSHEKTVLLWVIARNNIEIDTLDGQI